MVGSVLLILLVFCVVFCLSYSSRVPGFSQVFGGVCVTHLISFLCCVLFVYSSRVVLLGIWWGLCYSSYQFSVLCFVCLTLHVYQGSPRYLVGSVLLILLVFCVVFCLSYSSRVPGFSQVFGGVCVTHLISFLCCVLFVLLFPCTRVLLGIWWGLCYSSYQFSVLCFVCLTLPVYLGSPRYLVGSVLLILLVFCVVFCLSYSSRVPGFSQVFGGVCVTHLISFLCCVLFVLLFPCTRVLLGIWWGLCYSSYQFSVLCFVCLTLPVYLGSPRYLVGSVLLILLVFCVVFCLSYSSRVPGFSQVFGGVCVTHLISFLCCVLFVLFFPCCLGYYFLLAVLCFVCTLPVYLGSPRYLVGSVLLILLVFCVVFCLSYSSVYQGSPRYLVGSVLLILLVFCVVFCLSYSSRVPGFSQVFGGVCVTHLISFLCCVLFVLLFPCTWVLLGIWWGLCYSSYQFSVLCFVCLTLPVYLGSPRYLVGSVLLILLVFCVVFCLSYSSRVPGFSQVFGGVCVTHLISFLCCVLFVLLFPCTRVLLGIWWGLCYSSYQFSVLCFVCLTLPVYLGSPRYLVGSVLLILLVFCVVFCLSYSSRVPGFSQVFGGVCVTHLISFLCCVLFVLLFPCTWVLLGIWWGLCYSSYQFSVLCFVCLTLPVYQGSPRYLVGSVLLILLVFCVVFCLSYSSRVPGFSQVFGGVCVTHLISFLCCVLFVLLFPCTWVLLGIWWGLCYSSYQFSVLCFVCLTLPVYQGSPRYLVGSVLLILLVFCVVFCLSYSSRVPGFSQVFGGVCVTHLISFLCCVLFVLLFPCTWVLLGIWWGLCYSSYQFSVLCFVCLSSRVPGFSQVFGGVCVTHLISFLCCVLFVLLFPCTWVLLGIWWGLCYSSYQFSVLCFVCLTLPVYQGSPRYLVGSVLLILLVFCVVFCLSYSSRVPGFSQVFGGVCVTHLISFLCCVLFVLLFPCTWVLLGIWWGLCYSSYQFSVLCFVCLTLPVYLGSPRYLVGSVLLILLVFCVMFCLSYSSRVPGFSQVYGGVCVTHLISFLCYVLFVLLFPCTWVLLGIWWGLCYSSYQFSLLCFVCLILPVYLGSPRYMVGSVLLILLVFCVVFCLSYTSRVPGFSQVFGGVCVTNLISFLCCVLFVLLFPCTWVLLGIWWGLCYSSYQFSVLCFVCLTLPVYLGSPRYLVGSVLLILLVFCVVFCLSYSSRVPGFSQVFGGVCVTHLISFLCCVLFVLLFPCTWVLLGIWWGLCYSSYQFSVLCFVCLTLPVYLGSPRYLVGSVLLILLVFCVVFCLSYSSRVPGFSQVFGGVCVTHLISFLCCVLFVLLFPCTRVLLGIWWGLCYSSYQFSVLCFVCLILPVYQGSPRYLVGSVLLILLVFCVVFCLSYSSRVPGFSQVFGGVCVTHLISFLCCVLFVLLFPCTWVLLGIWWGLCYSSYQFSVLCFVCLTLPVYLGSPRYLVGSVLLILLVFCVVFCLSYSSRVPGFSQVFGGVCVTHLISFLCCVLFVLLFPCTWVLLGIWWGLCYSSYQFSVLCFVCLTLPVYQGSPRYMVGSVLLILLVFCVVFCLSYSSRVPGFSQVFGGVCVTNLISFLCCVLFVLLFTCTWVLLGIWWGLCYSSYQFSVLCFVCLTLPVYLGSPRYLVGSVLLILLVFCVVFCLSYSSRVPGFSQVFGGVCVTHLISFLCCVLFVLFFTCTRVLLGIWWGLCYSSYQFSVLCFVCLTLPVYLGSPRYLVGSVLLILLVFCVVFCLSYSSRVPGFSQVFGGVCVTHLISFLCCVLFVLFFTCTRVLLGIWWGLCYSSYQFSVLCFVCLTLPVYQGSPRYLVGSVLLILLVFCVVFCLSYSSRVPGFSQVFGGVCVTHLISFLCCVLFVLLFPCTRVLLGIWWGLCYSSYQFSVLCFVCLILPVYQGSPRYLVGSVLLILLVFCVVFCLSYSSRVPGFSQVFGGVCVTHLISFLCCVLFVLLFPCTRVLLGIWWGLCYSSYQFSVLCFVCLTLPVYLGSPRYLVGSVLLILLVFCVVFCLSYSSRVPGFSQVFGGVCVTHLISFLCCVLFVLLFPCTRVLLGIWWGLCYSSYQFSVLCFVCLTLPVYLGSPRYLVGSVLLILLVFCVVFCLSYSSRVPGFSQVFGGVCVTHLISFLCCVLFVLLFPCTWVLLGIWWGLCYSSYQFSVLCFVCLTLPVYLGSPRYLVGSVLLILLVFCVMFCLSYSSRVPGFSQVYGGVCVTHLISFLCYVLFVLLFPCTWVLLGIWWGLCYSSYQFSLLCFVCLILPVYLGSPRYMVGSVLLILLVFCVVFCLSYTSRVPGFSQVFGGVCVTNLISFLCCVLFVLLFPCTWVLLGIWWGLCYSSYQFSVLCFVCLTLPVYLGSPRYLVGSVLLILLVFCVVFCLSYSSRVPGFSQVFGGVCVTHLISFLCCVLFVLLFPCTWVLLGIWWGLCYSSYQFSVLCFVCLTLPVYLGSPRYLVGSVLLILLVFCVVFCLSYSSRVPGFSQVFGGVCVTHLISFLCCVLFVLLFPCTRVLLGIWWGLCYSSYQFSVLCFVCLILPVYQGSPRYLVGSVLLILLVFCVVFCLSYSSRVPGFSQVFGGVCVTHLISFLCCVLFVLLFPCTWVLLGIWWGLCYSSYQFSVLCFVCLTLPVYLGSPRYLVGSVLLILLVFCVVFCLSYSSRVPGFSQVFGGVCVTHLISFLCCVLFVLLFPCTWVLLGIWWGLCYSSYQFSVLCFVCLTLPVYQGSPRYMVGSVLLILLVFCVVFCLSYSSRVPGFSQVFGGVCVTHLISFLCCVLFVLLFTCTWVLLGIWWGLCYSSYQFSVLCFVCLTLPVYLGSPRYLVGSVLLILLVFCVVFCLSYSSRVPGFSQVFGGVCVTHLISFLCCVLFVLLFTCTRVLLGIWWGLCYSSYQFSVLCFVCLTLPVYLGSPRYLVGSVLLILLVFCVVFCLSYSSRVPGFSQVFGGVCVTHLISFLCCVLFVLFFRVPGFSQVFGGVCVTHLISFLCCVLFVLLFPCTRVLLGIWWGLCYSSYQFSVLCFVCLTLPVYLGSPRYLVGSVLLILLVFCVVFCLSYSSRVPGFSQVFGGVCVTHLISFLCCVLFVLLFPCTWVLLGIWWGLCYSSYQFSVLCFVCLTLPVYLGSPRYLVGSVLLILLVFCVVFCLSYSSRVPGFSQVFGGVCVTHLISFLCCVLFVLLFTCTRVLLGIWWGLCYSSYQFSVLCFVCLTLPVYLGSPRYLVGSVLLILLVFCVVFCLSYSSRVPGFSQVFGGVCVTHLISFLCCVLFVYSSRVPGFSQVFGGVCVTHLISFLCCVLFVLLFPCTWVLLGIWWGLCYSSYQFSVLCFVCLLSRVVLLYLVGSVLLILLVFCVVFCLSYSSRVPGFSQVFGGVCVTHLISFLCCVLFVLLFPCTWVLLGIWWGLCYSSYQFSVLCFVCLTLPVYQGSPRYLVGSVLLILLVFCVVFCLSYSSRVPGFSQVFGGVCVTHLISFLCCVLFVLFFPCTRVLLGIWWGLCY